MMQQMLTQHRHVTIDSNSRNEDTPRLSDYVRTVHDTNSHLDMSSLYVCLLGNFVFLVDGASMSRLEMPRLQSLLAYLALHRSVPQSRSRIAFTLWPDSTDAQAHTNLRNLLFKLRATLPEVEAFLLIDRLTICWQPDRLCHVDVQDFEQAVERATEAHRLEDSIAERQALEEAALYYQGDLLPGCYEDWIIEERDRLRQLYLAVLERLMELLEETGDHTEAIRLAQRLVRLDPLQEGAYCHLMRLHAARGDSAAISRTYQACTTVLKRELAIEPASTTRKIYERLMRAED